MKQSVLKNNSLSPVDIPLFEREEAVVVTKSIKWKTLNPGEEVILGPDVPTDRIRYYEALKAINVDVEKQEVPDDTFKYEEISGVRICEKRTGKVRKYEGNNFVTVKYDPAVIKKATNPNGVTTYWQGIGVVAPEGAVALVRSAATSQSGLDKLKPPVLAKDFDKNVLDGKPGWFFYADAAGNPSYQWARAIWLAEDNSIIQEMDYYMDFSDLKLEK